MKQAITILMLFAPLFVFCQSKGYTTPFNDLAITQTGTTDLAPKKENSTDRLHSLPLIPINTSDQSSVSANAIITITGIPSATEAENIRLTREEDNSKVIAPQPLDANGNLVFQLGSQVGPANGKFQIFYKGKSQGVYQFQLTKSSSDSGGSGSGGGKKNDDKGLTDYVGVMANANFIGNNKFLSNLTPIVTLGIITSFVNKDTIIKGKKKSFSWSLDANPYLGAQIDTKDSASFIPALMLPGRVGLILNNYLTWQKDEVLITFMPLGFGLKLIPNLKDSNTVVFQHNFRTGIALGYTDVFLLGVQYTYGFHNTTSESERFYKQVFNKGATDISYLTISGQFILKSTDDTKKFVYVEWRGLTSKNKYSPFPNNSILTVGYRSDLSLTGVFSASTGKRTSRPTPF